MPRGTTNEKHRWYYERKSDRWMICSSCSKETDKRLKWVGLRAFSEICKLPYPYTLNLAAEEYVI